MEVIKKCFQKNLKDSNDSWHFLTTSQWMNSKDAIFFIWIRLIFGQNPCFSGPRQLGRWKVNRSLLTDSSLLSSDQNCPQFFIVTQFSQLLLKLGSFILILHLVYLFWCPKSAIFLQKTISSDIWIIFN